MLVATIKMRVDPDHQNELMQTFRSLRRPILEQTGCLGCSFFHDIEDDNVVMMVEAWESETHWKRHLVSTEFSVLLGAIGLFDPKAGKFQLLTGTEGVAELREMRQTNLGAH